MHSALLSAPSPETVLRAAGPSSLDTQRKSVFSTHQDTQEQAYRFAFVADERSMWLRHLDELPLGDRKREKFKACGTDAWVQWSAARQQARISSLTCGQRFCPACQRRRAAKIANRIALMVGSAGKSNVRFITLTLKHGNAPLEDQVRSLRKSFKQLRAKPLWKRHVVGGFAVIEITRNNETHHWHPHLHVLAIGTYIPQAGLSTAWWSVTHTSKIVDIRQVRRTADAVRYITKYLCKPQAAEIGHSPELVQQYFAALQRTHWCITFGKRGLLPKPEPDPNPNDWHNVGRLADLLQQGSPGGWRELARQLTLNHATQIVLETFEDGHDPPIEHEE
jgi:hypothetical protein